MISLSELASFIVAKSEGYDIEELENSIWCPKQDDSVWSRKNMYRVVRSGSQHVRESLKSGNTVVLCSTSEVSQQDADTKARKYRGMTAISNEHLDEFEDVDGELHRYASPIAIKTMATA